MRKWVQLDKEQLVLDLCVMRTVLSVLIPQRAHPGLDSGATPSMAALATDPAQHAVTSCIAGMICVSLIVRALLASSSSSHLIIVCQTSSARSLNKTSNKVAI